MVNISRDILPNPAEIAADIRDLVLADYHHAIDLSLQRLVNQPGICFVGQFGSINTPGVSDIDLLVVVRDEDFKTVYAKSRHIPQEIPNGAYLFVDSIIVVPYSLTRVSRVLHSFKNLGLLWGNSSILNLLREPDFPLTFINAIIWNSHLWDAAARLCSYGQSLRHLLLVLRNFVQSIAINYELLQQAGKSELALRWGNEARDLILAAPAEQRRALVVQYLGEALCKWMEADWELQEWWMQTVKPRAWSIDRFELPLGPRTVAQFTQENKNNSRNQISLPTEIDQNVEQSNGANTLVLPSFYLEVILAVNSTFEPWLNSAHFERAKEIIDLGFLDIPLWNEAIRIYKDAVGSIRAFTKENALDELEMYRQISCLPFGQQYLEEPVRRGSSLKRLKAATSKIMPSIVRRHFDKS